MKKSKIFAPLLSVAGLTATVAPMVTLTSCHDDETNSASYQFIKDGTATETYTAKITPKAAGEAFAKPTDPISAATKSYMTDLKANPAILADDVFVMLNEITKAKYKNFTVTISNVGISKTLRVQGEDIPLLTATIKLDIDHHDDKAKGCKETATFTINNMITNVEFTDGKDPEFVIDGSASVEEEVLTSASINFEYKYVENDGTTATELSLFANNEADAKAMLDFTSLMDDSVQAVASIIAGNTNIKSTYFSLQTELTA